MISASQFLLDFHLISKTYIINALIQTELTKREERTRLHISVALVLTCV